MRYKKRNRPDKDGKDKSAFTKYKRKLLRVCEEDGFIMCGICGLPINVSLPYPNPWSLTIDHIVPIVQGGETKESNLQPAHFRCNRKKGEHAGLSLEDINSLREEQRAKPIYSKGELRYIKSVVLFQGSKAPEDKEKALRGLPQSANWRTF